MILKFLRDLALKALVGFLEFQQKRGLAEIRRRLAGHLGRVLRHTAAGLRRAAWGLVAVAAVGAGLVLVPLTAAALLVGICNPANWQTAVLIAAAVVGVFALVYLGLGCGLLWSLTSEKAVRDILHADDLERRLRGDD